MVGEQPVSEIMVPRTDIVALSTAASVEENLERLADSPHTRFPLVGEEMEDFRGIVYVPMVATHLSDLEDGDTTFEDLAAPPMTVSPETSVSDLIDQFQAESQELALVIADGRVEGLVTATDAFEEVMGELEDPMDTEELA